jgi:hypothetical protein
LADWVRPRVIFIALLECFPHGWYRVDPVDSNPRNDAKNDAKAGYVKLLSLFLKECWIQFLKPVSKHYKRAYVQYKKQEEYGHVEVVFIMQPLFVGLRGFLRGVPLQEHSDDENREDQKDGYLRHYQGYSQLFSS